MKQNSENTICSYFIISINHNILALHEVKMIFIPNQFHTNCQILEKLFYWKLYIFITLVSIHLIHVMCSVCSVIEQ